MPDLFALAMPWWEFILRAVVVYAVVLGMVRLGGKRALGQITPFDVLLIVLLGNAVQNALLGTDTCWGPAAGGHPDRAELWGGLVDHPESAHGADDRRRAHRDRA